jgi:hypothetical protein
LTERVRGKRISESLEVKEEGGGKERKGSDLRCADIVDLRLEASFS